MRIVERRPIRWLLCAACCAVLILAAGCARAKNIPPTQTVEPAMPIGEGPVQRVPSSTPKQAVTAYLAAASGAYFSLEASIIAPYVTEEQEVREDAYIQLNRQEGRALEMEMTAFTVLMADEPSVDATSAVVRTKESWRWRYWSLADRAPSTQWADTVYEVEYGLERSGNGWLVARTKVLSQSGDTTPTPLP